MEFVCLLEEMIVSDRGVNWVLGLRVFKAELTCARSPAPRADS